MKLVSGEYSMVFVVLHISCLTTFLEEPCPDCRGLSGQSTPKLAAGQCRDPLSAQTSGIPCGSINNYVLYQNGTSCVAAGHSVVD